MSLALIDTKTKRGVVFYLYIYVLTSLYLDEETKEPTPSRPFGPTN